MTRGYPRLVTGPTGLALDWESEVEGHLRLDSEDERARIESLLVPAAMRWCEAFTNRQLLTATRALDLDSFPCDPYAVIELPRAPLVSVTSIKYYDQTQLTLAPARYVVQASTGEDGPPGTIWPAYNDAWPTTDALRMRGVEIVYVCGYGATYATIPAALRQAMLLIVGELFKSREESVLSSMSPAIMCAEDVARPFKIPTYREGIEAA